MPASGNARREGHPGLARHGPRAEGRKRKAEGGRQKAEGGRQKAEGRRQKAEGRRRMAEGRRRKAEGGRLQEQLAGFSLLFRANPAAAEQQEEAVLGAGRRL